MEYNGIMQLTNEQYHSSPGVSRSGLWKFQELPAKYYYEYLSGEYEREQKKAWDVGELFHTLVLEPHLFESKFYVFPKVDRRTTAGKQQYAIAKAAAGERILINKEEYEMAQKMRDSLYADETIRLLMSGHPQIEKSIYWTDEETGILCKVRPDVWNAPLIGDLKSTKDASMRAIQNSAYAYGYYLQAAMIKEALKSIDTSFSRFIMATVEKTAPYCAAFYIMTEEAIAFGEQQFRNLLRMYARCLEASQWPSYGMHLLDVPSYANAKKINHEMNEE